MPTHDVLRRHLLAALDGRGAHVDFDAALRDLPEALRGRRPEGLPYSPWELLEHLRFTQRDLLDFCRDSDYAEPDWPGDYWPDDPAPPSPEAWDASVAAFREDLEALQALITDPTTDLLAEIPHGDGQTYLREVLLVIDHNAYHLGQLVAVRRLLGAWPTGA